MLPTSTAALHKESQIKLQGWINSNLVFGSLHPKPKFPPGEYVKALNQECSLDNMELQIHGKNAYCLSK